MTERPVFDTPEALAVVDNKLFVLTVGTLEPHKRICTNGSYVPDYLLRAVPEDHAEVAERYTRVERIRTRLRA